MRYFAIGLLVVLAVFVSGCGAGRGVGAAGNGINVNVYIASVNAEGQKNEATSQPANGSLLHNENITVTDSANVTVEASDGGSFEGALGGLPLSSKASSDGSPNPEETSLEGSKVKPEPTSQPTQ